MAWLHGVISGNHKHATAACIYIAVPMSACYRLTCSLVYGHKEHREVVCVCWGSVSLLPKPSAWSGTFCLMYSAISEVRSSQCVTSDEFQSILWQRGVQSKPLRQKLREIMPHC